MLLFPCSDVSGANTWSGVCGCSLAVMCLDVGANTWSGVCGSPLKTLEVFSITQDQVRPLTCKFNSIQITRRSRG